MKRRPPGPELARMPPMRALLVLAATVALACGPWDRQNESPPADEEPTAAASATAERARTRLEASEGGRLVLRAIEAHGGLERWYATPTSSFGWEYSNERAGLRFRTEMVAHNRTREVYHDVTSLGTPDRPEPFTGRMAWTGEEAWFVPADDERINARFWATTGYYFEMIPFVFADPGARYERLPDQVLDGETYHMVKVGYEEGVGDADDYYVAYVDRRTGRVRAIRYVVTFGGRPAGIETLFYYDDRTTVDGLTVATRFRGFAFRDGEKGAFRNEAWADEIEFGVPFDTTRLAVPDSARIDPLPGAG